MKLVLAPPSPLGVFGILGAGRDDHARYRRLLSHAFSTQGLREQEPRITGYADKLMDGLAAASKTESSLDILSWFNWTTFDVIGDLAFGESFNCLDRTQTHPWIHDLFGNLKFGAVAVALRDYGLMRLMNYLTPRKLVEARKENFQYVSEMVERRVELGEDRGDFFDHVLKQPGEKGKYHYQPHRFLIASPGMTLSEMKANASNIVIAGSETTATALSGLIHVLLTNPTVHSHVTNEVRSAFASRSEMTIASTSPTTLPYLHASLTECLRIYSPVPTAAPRIVPRPGETVEGIWLPGGTTIHFMHHVAYNLPSNFYLADEFHPERWFPASSKSIKSEGVSPSSTRPTEFDGDNTAAFHPFSIGPRNCIGQNLAWAEMSLIMARLLWEFDVSRPTDGTKERAVFDAWKTEQKVKILWEKGPLPVSLKERL